MFPCRSQREWRAFERAMARRRGQGAVTTSMEAFIGKRVTGGTPDALVFEAGNSLFLRVLPES